MELKHKIPLLFLLFNIACCWCSLFGQVPGGINFQAIARDITGNPYINSDIQVRLTVIDSAIGGALIYQEQRTLKTSSNGTFSIILGQDPDIINNGDFNSINWQSGNKYLKIDYDPTNSSSFTLSPLMMKFSFVPYAFFADNVIYINPEGAQQGDLLYFNASSGKFEPGNEGYNAGIGISLNNNTISNAGDINNTNELQTLSIHGDTLFLSNGGYVRLPYAFPSSFSPPLATALPACDVQPYTATINGKVNPRGLTSQVDFEWGLNTGYGQVIVAQPGVIEGFNDVFVSAQIVVKSGTTYHYRIKATNAVGSSYSNDMLFVSAFSVPEIITQEPSSITSTGFIGGGDVVWNGGIQLIDKGLCWSTSPHPTTADNHTSNGAGNGQFTTTVSGLIPGTTYYIRTYAINSLGTAYGNEVTCTTNEVLCTLTTTAISAITPSTALSGGTITMNGGGQILQRGVCWSTTPNPTIADIISTDGVGSGVFTSSLNGLETGKTYYVRAYATNSAGTSYGNVLSFTAAAVTVGDTYQGGVVAYLLEPGDPGYIAGEIHGIITTPYDLGNFSYGCMNTNLPGAEGYEIGTGAQNTLDIITNCSETDIAAKKCADLILNEYSDWHLPSINELSKLYTLWSMGGLSYYMLSSTEMDEYMAYGFYFSGNWSISVTKNGTMAVRAVRLF
ncbi:MAG: hypothetical protein PHR81_02035 [Bacteroidales bacterium]|jgi:hypothetical protein|nr:DUF1566 domain-containing protein [Bacteroidales bacterium]MDD4213569.1 hypothetical protein [Bacteroidales bacterium]